MLRVGRFPGRAARNCAGRLYSMAAAPGHVKCRNKDYQGKVARTPVPDEKVSWSVEWPDYKPVDYTAPSVAKGPVWADPDFR